ncbi:hypothetical protein BH24ACT19_BH24ACT19_18790 [soil metagenome]
MPDRRTIALGTAIFTLGVTAGSLWGGAEWMTGQLFNIEVVYGLSDTMTALIANSIGALAAALAIHERGSR